MDLDERSRVYIEVTLGLPRHSWKQNKIEKLFQNFLTILYFFLKFFPMLMNFMTLLRLLGTLPSLQD